VTSTKSRQRERAKVVVRVFPEDGALQIPLLVVNADEMHRMQAW